MLAKGSRFQFPFNRAFTNLIFGRRMKAQIDFPLQSAEWPSVVIDGSGFIHAFNRAAVSLFGVAVEASEARLRDRKSVV